MGYYSGVEFDINNAKVDIQKTKDVEQFFYSNEGVYGFYNVKFDLDGEKLTDIVLEEYYSKFYDDQLFANKLTEVLTSGEVRLYFSGEDGDRWGYVVTPGEVKEITYKGFDEDELRVVEKVKEILDGDNAIKKEQLLKLLEV